MIDPLLFSVAAGYVGVLLHYVGTTYHSTMIGVLAAGCYAAGIAGQVALLRA